MTQTVCLCVCLSVCVCGGGEYPELFVVLSAIIGSPESCVLYAVSRYSLYDDLKQSYTDVTRIQMNPVCTRISIPATAYIVHDPGARHI